MVIIFNQVLSDEKHDLLMDKISKYEDFSINKYNFVDFFDCQYVIDILNDKKINYEITLDDGWNKSKNKEIDYSVYGKILITDAEYILVKDIFKEIERISETQVDPEDDISESDPVVFIGKHGEKMLGYFYIACFLLPIILCIIAYH